MLFRAGRPEVKLTAVAVRFRCRHHLLPALRSGSCGGSHGTGGGAAGGRDRDAEHGRLTVHPPISPGGVLPDQAQDERADGADRGRAPGSLRPAGTGVTPLHQLAVPAQDGVRADDKPQPTQDRSGQRGQKSGQEDEIPRGGSRPGIGAEPPFENGDPMTQGEDLGILVRSLIGSSRSTAKAFVTVR